MVDILMQIPKKCSSCLFHKRDNSRTYCELLYTIYQDWNFVDINDKLQGRDSKCPLIDGESYKI